MSSETPETETPETETADKASFSNSTVRPPDVVRDSKNDPLRAGFREKPNKGSKAQGKNKKNKKKKR